MVGRVIPDDVHDRGRRAPGVVQIGEAIGQPRTQMQQGRGGLAGDAAIAVRRAGGDAFEQTQHRAHGRGGIERGDKMHFRRAGIGEADFDAAIDQRLSRDWAPFIPPLP